MQSKHDYTLKDVIEKLIKAYKWDDSLDAVRLINSWDKIVGNIMASHTTRLNVKNRKLYVSVDSSVIRNELMMSRSKIVESINVEMGFKMIDDLVLR